MTDIKIRVGAALDSSLNAVFRALTDAARKAGQQVAGESARSGKDAASAYRGSTSEAIRLIKERTKQEQKAAKEAARIAEQEAKDRVKAERDKAAAIAYIRKLNAREEEREMKARERATDAMMRGAGRTALRMGRAVIGAGTGVAGGLARAFGVQTDAGQLLGASASRETMATQISNASSTGNQPLVNPSELMAQANAVAMQTGTSAEDNLKGLQAFVGLTGDLATGRDILAEMGKLSKATGSSMEDMVDAAAQVANAMGDIPDKGKAISQTMRVFAGQGQIGAVEIKNMASQMAKLAAQANNFKIDPKSAAILAAKGVTNSTGQNLAVMGAMAQIARAQGGRSSATLATGSSMAFMRDLSSKTELKRMSEAGIDVFADKGKTTARDPKQIMLDILSKTKGSMPAIANLLPNQNSRAVLNGLAQDYRRGTDAITRQKGEGDMAFEQRRNAAGVKAASDAFDRFLSVAMDSPEITAKFNQAMNTTETQAQLVNNEFAKTADALRADLLPAIVALTPHIVQLAGSLSKWIADVTGTSSKKREDDVRHTVLANLETQQRMRVEAGEAQQGDIPDTIRRAGVPALWHTVPNAVSDADNRQNHADLQSALADLESKRREVEASLPKSQGGTAEDNKGTFAAAAAGAFDDKKIELEAIKRDIASVKEGLVSNESMQRAFEAALASGTILRVEVTNQPQAPMYQPTFGGRAKVESAVGP